VVIGAGPAGLCAARKAAELGADVLLLEAEERLATKPCGEGLLKGVLRELGMRASDEFVRNEVEGAYLFGPCGTVLEVRADQITYERFRGRGGGYIIDKEAFLGLLMEEAEEAGADIRLGARVVGFGEERGRRTVVFEGKSSTGRVSCDVVIGCDGYKSVTARKLFGLGPQEAIPCLQYVVEGCRIDEPDMVRAYVGRRWAPLGYLWVFPKGEDVANVGVGVRKAVAKEYLDKFVEENREFFGGARIADVGAALVPIGGQRERVVMDGAMLCGDAAGQVVPITGEGIHPAMTAGLIAGEVAAKAVGEGDTSAERLSEYERRFNERWGGTLELGLLARLAFEKLPDEKIDRVLALMASGSVDINSAVMVIDGPDIGPFIRSFFEADPDFCLEVFGSLVEEVMGSASG